MTAVVRTRAGDVAGAAVQTVAAVAAHVAADGCLPAAGPLALSLPTAVVAVLLVGRLLRGRVLSGLLAGQVAVHGVLVLVAACTGGHGHSAPLMAYAHVGALVAVRAVLERVLVATETAVRAAAGLVGRLLRPYARPVLLVPHPSPCAGPAAASPPRAGAGHPGTPHRGPPAARARVLTPA